MVRVLQPRRISTEGSFWSGALGCSTTLARRLIFTGILAICLTACDERVRIALPPVELARCADEPIAPDLPAPDGSAPVQLARDQMTFAYILALRSAWGDCRSKVDGLAAWRDTAGR